MWWISIWLIQDVQGQAAQVRAAMQSSLEMQRASLQRQNEVTARPPLTVRPRASTEVPPQELPCKPVPAPDLDQMIQEVAGEQRLEPAVIREVARQESAFYPCVISPKGAVGLMQLMPETQSRVHVSDPLDPRESLTGGAKLLRELLDRYHGDLKLALAAYNAGTAPVDRESSVPEIGETQRYVRDILRRLDPILEQGN